MGVSDVEIVLIDVTFYFQHFQKLVFNGVIKKQKTNIIGSDG